MLPGGTASLDHIQVVVESDAEIRIVPGYQRPLELRQQEPQILAENFEIHGLIGHHRIDAKTASIRTPEAPQHGNHLNERRLLESWFDELPALAYPWKRPRLLFGAHLHTVWSMLRAIPQDVAEGLPVRKAQDVVEVAGGVFRVAPGVRPSDCGYGSFRAEEGAQGIGCVGRLGEGADEDQVDPVRQFLQ
jgi:hypothetical protein